MQLFWKQNMREYYHSSYNYTFRNESLRDDQKNGPWRKYLDQNVGWVIKYKYQPILTN